MTKSIAIKIIRNILAAICFVLWIIGGFLPLTPGALFFVIGIFLLDFKGKEKAIQWTRDHLQNYHWGQKLIIWYDQSSVRAQKIIQKWKSKWKQNKWDQ